MRWLTLLFITILLSPAVLAEPFDTCPSKAYLFQSKPVQVYGVNLVTGETNLLQADTGTNGNINAVGFDYEDRYIYGYDTTNKEVVRLGKDFQSQTLNVTGLPTHTFYVGDVYQHVLYLYRKGNGLFKVELSPLDADPTASLPLVKITDIATVSLTDFAFHPGNGKLYGVDNSSGDLYVFDTSVGGETLVGNVGVTGTFGAGYFDVNGYYYISRNPDGHVFRIDLSDPDNITDEIIEADIFAYGPASGQNDGARCANAPVIDEDSTIDFGDAPSSYTTLLDDNGPRHGIGSDYYLGFVAPDGEGDGLLAPLDDNKAGLQDEDGVGFVTAIEAGMNSIVSVQASTTGYLSAWIDWNKDGDFTDQGEQVFTDTILSEGSNSLILSVPNDVTMGSTWSRFRFSDQTGIDYFGGAQKGEVEDHPVLITKDGVAIRHYPSESTYATVAFEDNWPYTADYDMNDVVVRYRVTETLQDGKVSRTVIQGYVAAYGAEYRNGFAIRLAGLNRTDIDTDLSTMTHNGTQQPTSGLEAISDEAIFIISEDLSDVVLEGCNFYRTLQNCQEILNFSFELDITVEESSDSSSLMGMPYDPFIFATPNYYHGEGVTFQPGRKWEVHVADQAPTEQFDDSLFGRGVDSSDETVNRYYKTDANLPWALLISSEWKWPQEKVELLSAYPDFADYAESAGQQSQDWHSEENANNTKFYLPQE
ncbi:LruC domain-containing protein [Vibrio sp. ZSDE26]|uniref:LruC domain-containing protein n=1 Tax=Vibrio amylolyticus TaxID=2847292 RepID=A0A9X1XK49_9VIBR|nr:LruC domain-containing protein [Vibrio amylolyticus]MCK6263625.1 LruC domain-containing protein [Vibrio amylolyticus]